MDRTTWEPQIEHFADDYRVVTLDVRGHGNTGVTEPDQYSIDLFTDDLGHCSRDSRSNSPILCGLSLGSMKVVQEYLDRRSDDAAGAILGRTVRSVPRGTAVRSEVVLVADARAGHVASLSVSGSAGTFRSMLYSIQATTGERWLSVDPNTRADAIDAVGDIPSAEFRKRSSTRSTGTIARAIRHPKRRRSSSRRAGGPLIKRRGPTDRLGRRRRHATPNSRSRPSRQPGPAASVRSAATGFLGTPRCVGDHSLSKGSIRRTASVNRSHGYSVSRSRHRSLSGSPINTHESRLAAQHKFGDTRNSDRGTLAASAGHSNDTPTQNQINGSHCTDTDSVDSATTTEQWANISRHVFNSYVEANNAFLAAMG